MCICVEQVLIEYRAARKEMMEHQSSSQTQVSIEAVLIVDTVIFSHVAEQKLLNRYPATFFLLVVVVIVGLLLLMTYITGQ